MLSKDSENDGNLAGGTVDAPGNIRGNVRRLSDILMKSEPSATDLFFKTLVDRSFSRNEIETVYRDEPTQYSPAVAARIEEEWSKIVARRPGASPGSPGSLIGLRALAVSDNGRLLLELGPTNYKEYRGTVALSEEERRQSNYELANPLAGAMIVYSQKAFDGRGGLLLSRRSEKLLHHPGGIEFPGGNVDREDVDESGNINPIVTALREAREEQGVRDEDLENIRLLAIVYEFYQDAAPTSIVIANLKDDVDLEELASRQRDLEGRPMWLPADPESLTKFILDYSTMCSPFVLGGFYFFLKFAQHQPEKAEYFLNRLRRRGEIYKRLPNDKLAEIELKKKARSKF